MEVLVKNEMDANDFLAPFDGTGGLIISTDESFKSRVGYVLCQAKDREGKVKESHKGCKENTTTSQGNKMRMHQLHTFLSML